MKQLMGHFLCGCLVVTDIPICDMRKIIFLHGFFSAGDCGIARTLKEELVGVAEVFAPDLSIHPRESLSLIRSLCDELQPDLLVGNSCGSFYAQQIASAVGFPALLGNPYFRMSEFLAERIGAHSFKAPRKDGVQDFVIDESLVREFAEVEAHQFDSYNPDYKDRIWGLFGDNDPIAHFKPLFEKYYSTAFSFPGQHTPTDEEVREYYVPLIHEMLVRFPRHT